MELRISGNHPSTPGSAAVGQVVEGFREGVEYLIEYVGEPGTQLLVDEEILSITVNSGVAHWMWKPGFYAGRVRAELRRADHSILSQYVLNVSPDDRKLEHDEFNVMVEELAAFRDALLLGTEPARIAIGAEGEFTSLNLQYGRIAQYGDEFCKALKSIKQQPIRKVVNTRTVVPAMRARRIDYQTIRNCAQSPLAVILKKNQTAHQRMSAQF